MDMQIVVFYRLLDLFAQQVIVDERLGRFAGELHHHAGGRVGIHIGILAGDVVGFDIDDLQEHIACLGFAGDAALVAVSYVFLCNVFAATVHQFQLDSVLDGFDSHLRVAFERNMIRDLANQLPVFPVFCVQHRFADSCCYLFFVESNDTSITFNNCLNHDKFIIEVCEFCSCKSI